MPYPIVRIDPTTQGRERSVSLWRGTLDRYAANPQLGVLYEDDFNRPRIGVVATSTDGWCLVEDGVIGATVEAFQTNGEAGGVCVLSATTGADYIGVKAQAGSLIAGATGEGITLPTATTDSKAEVVCEARVYLDTAANDTCLVALAEHTATLKTLGAVSALPDDSDYIGFYRIDGGDLQFVVRNDNAGGVAVEYNVNIVAAADVTNADWVKLGFRVNHDNTVEVFVDGTRVRKDTAGATISVPSTALPIEALTRTLSVGRGATNDNATVSLKCDKIECYVGA